MQTKGSDSNQLTGFSFSGRGSITDMSGEMQIRVAGLVETKSTTSLGRQEVLVNGETENNRFNFVDVAEAILVRSQVSLPRNSMDIMNLAAPLGDGLAFEASTTTPSYYTSQNVEINGEVVSEQSTRVGEQSALFALDKSGFRIIANLLDAQFDMLLAEDSPFALNARF